MSKLESLKEKVRRVCSKIERFNINTIGLRDFVDQVTEVPEGLHKVCDKWITAFEENEVSDLIYIDAYLPLNRRLEIEKRGNTDFQEYRKFKACIGKVRKALRECPSAFRRQKAIKPN